MVSIDEDELFATISALRNAAAYLDMEACRRELAGENEDRDRLVAAREWCEVRAEELSELL
jgi:hypothetical protein